MISIAPLREFVRGHVRKYCYVPANPNNYDISIFWWRFPTTVCPVWDEMRQLEVLRGPYPKNIAGFAVACRDMYKVSGEWSRIHRGQRR